MKNFKMILVSGLISLVLVACNSQQDESLNIEAQGENQSAKQVDVQMKTDDLKDARTYVNQTDAWKVELPQVWNDVRIVEDGRITDFVFPSENSADIQSIVRIFPISENDWEKLQENGPLGTMKEITRKNGEVYVYQTPLDMILQGEEIKRFEVFSKEISTIIESFQFE